MLFNFVPTGAAVNWLQAFLLDLTIEAVKSRANGVTARTWKQMVEAPERAVLRARSSLKSRYKDLLDAANSISVADAANLLATLTSNTLYQDVLSGSASYQPFQALPEKFILALGELFSAGFDLLGKLKATDNDNLSIRDRLYTDLYDSIPANFCPFCGIDRFDAPHPDLPRHSLDHYLAISIYPLFGAHLPNLVPMCDRCNSRFKLTANMLVDDNGVARKCVNPYGNQRAEISLLNSTPFGGASKGRCPIWAIDFDPPDPAFNTWDAVFSIKVRYKESHLDADYLDWLRTFGQWASDKGIQILTNQDAHDALLNWVKLCPQLDDFGFLKRPVFKMLAAAAANNDAMGDRVTNLVRNVVALGN